MLHTIMMVVSGVLGQAATKAATDAAKDAAKDASNASKGEAGAAGKTLPDTKETVANTTGLTWEQTQALFETYGLPAVKAIVLLIVGWVIASWISSLVRRACDRANFDITLGRFLSNVIRWLMLAAVVIMCLSSFGVQVTSLVALLGTIGVAIGLALQGSLSHIASGVMLLIFRPFKVGDFVTAGGQTGSVEEIGLFSTLLTTLDNRRIIVPNGAIVGGVITNTTHFDERVAEVVVQADAGGSIDRERVTLRAAADGVQGRIPAKAPGVALTAIGATNTWSVTVWCKTSDLDVVRERLLVACNQALASSGQAPPVPVTLVKHV
jgi:small conductance mechanosensitive channel